MDLLSLLLGLPLAPVRGVVALAEVLRDQAERELYDPNVARRQLEEVDRQRRTGQISPDEEARKQQQVLDRMISQPDDPTQRRGPREKPGRPAGQEGSRG